MHFNQYMPPPPQLDDNNTEVKVLAPIIKHEINDDNRKELVKKIILDCSTNMYHNLRVSINETYHDKLPSFFLATKHYPKLLSREIEFKKELFHLLPASLQMNLENNNNADDYIGKKVKVKKKFFSQIEGDYF